MEPTLDSICSQLSSSAGRAGQPALKDILLHLQEKLVSKREMENEINDILHYPDLKLQSLTNENKMIPGF